MLRLVSGINYLGILVMLIAVSLYAGIKATQITDELKFNGRVIPASKSKKHKQKPVYFMKKSQYKGK